MCIGQYDENTTTASTSLLDIEGDTTIGITIATTIGDYEESTENPFMTTSGLEAEGLTFTTLDLPESGDWRGPGFEPIGNMQPRMMPIRPQSAIVGLGVLHDSQGQIVRKRCRCIEKKRNKVIKEVKYIPLAPAIQFEGNKRNFTCKCSHLRKTNKN